MFVYERKKIVDSRGEFSRMYCRDSLMDYGLREKIAQINRSSTVNKGTIRGLHFQHPPSSESKIITCLKGEIYDVAVDLREGSSTFLNHFGIKLNDTDQYSIVIPKGFAHGFQALVNDCEILYLHTSNYNPDAEDGFNPFDSTLSIKWPLETSNISDRDSQLPIINSDYTGITF